MQTHRSISLKLAERMLKEQPVSAAKLLEQFPSQSSVALLQAFPPEMTSKLLPLLAKEKARDILIQWPIATLPALTHNLMPGTLSRLLRLSSAAQQQLIFKYIPMEILTTVKKLLMYAEDSAGALMDPNIFSVTEDISILEARGLLLKTRSKITSYVYITNRDDKLKGVLSIRELFRAESHLLVSSIMHTSISALPAHTRRKAIISHPGWQQFHALPVVGHDNDLLGLMPHRILRQLGKPESGSNQSSPLIALSELAWAFSENLLNGIFTNLPRKKQPNREN